MPNLLNDVGIKIKRINKLSKNDNIELVNSLSRLSNSEDIVMKLRKEGLTKQEDLVELVREMISCGKGSFVAKNIRAFCIIDQNELFELCNKLINEKLGNVLIDNFNKFALRWESKRLSVALKLIDNGLGYRVIDNLSRFRISRECNKVKLIKKIMACTSCRLTPYMVRNIDKFKLKYSKNRQSLANKLVDINLGDLLIDNIAKFRINREFDLLALIDRLIDLNYGYLLIDNIENFNLNLHKRGFELAKKLVRNNGYKLIYNIRKFKIDREEDRVYIARQLIKGYMYTFIENIDLFDICNKCELLEEFVIRDKKDTCLLKTGLGRYEQRIVNMNRIFNVIIFKKNVSLDMIELYRDSLATVSETKLLEDEVGMYEKTISNVDKLRDYCNNKKINFDLCKVLGNENKAKIMDAISSIKEDRRKNDAQEIVEKMMFAYINAGMELNNKDELTELMVELIVMKDSQLKKELLPIVAKFINSGNLDKIKDEKKYSSKKKSFPAINAVVFYRLWLYKKKNKEVLLKIRNAFDNSNFLRNSIDVCETFRKMIKLELIQIEQSKVIEILAFLSNKPKNICKNLGYILNIITLKGWNSVDKITENFDEEKLHVLFYQAYSEFLKMNHDENFIVNYESFINRSDNVKRNLGEYILKYVADNSCDEDVMKVVQKFISTMHDISKFRNYKYDIKSDNHLHKLKSIDNDVYLKWTTRQKEFEYIREGSRAQITDDPVDLFLLGTEVDGSCQSIKGRRELNKCLIGIIGDGKNKAVVVKENDRIIARCIVRLLVDDYTKRIVMVREKMYKVNGVDSGIIYELNKECIDYARWLGVSLVCEDVNSLINHNMTLVSYGGRAKYEYVDLARKLFDTGGNYVVNNDKLVYLYDV